MKKVLMISTIAAAFLSAHVEASSYQFAGRLGMLESTFTESNNSFEATTDIFTAGAIAYLKPVTTEGKPLAKAAFLSKASFIEGYYSDASIEDNFNAFDESISGAIFLGRYVDEQTGFLIEGSISTGDYDDKSIGFGSYVTPSTSVVINFSPSNDTYENSFGIDVETIENLNNGTFAGFNLGVNRREFKDFSDSAVTEILGAADYYFSDKASAGVTVGVLAGDDSGKVFGVQGEIFPLENMSIAADYTETTYDDLDQKDKVFSLGFEVRL